MRIIDKNTDFYDYWQNVYRDDSITFDRTDSFLVTKEILCEHLWVESVRHGFIAERNKNRFLLLQICNTFWLFLVEITKESNYDKPIDYDLEFLTTWKNYNKDRKLISLDVIDLDFSVDMQLYQKRNDHTYDKDRIRSRMDSIIQAIDTNNFRVMSSIDYYAFYKGNYQNKVEKHIPLLKACGIGNSIDSLEVFLAFEEYFSHEKTSTERTASIGLTNDEKISNHGFDLKESFRGKA